MSTSEGDGKSQRIMLLLPLLRRKLKSVISNGNCKLRIFLLLIVLIVVFLVVSSQSKNMGEVDICM